MTVSERQSEPLTLFIFLCPFSATPLLQSDIAALYIKVGVKNIGTVFLHTDAQIPDERFLVLINDMLASGVATLTESDCLRLVWCLVFTDGMVHRSRWFVPRLHFLVRALHRMAKSVCNAVFAFFDRSKHALLSVSHRPGTRYKLSEHCLCYLGDIPDLFSDEEMDMIVMSIRMELRGLGLIDSRDNCWSFFIERIRRQLKVLIMRHPVKLYLNISFIHSLTATFLFGLQVVLCFSPVGFTLRTRARKFPALVNCTAIDWFHPWPQVALQSVSSTFIEKIPGLEVRSHSPLFLLHSTGQKIPYILYSRSISGLIPCVCVSYAAKCAVIHQ